MQPPYDSRRVARIAARQHGVVTYQQLVDCGMSRQRIRTEIAAGRLILRHSDVYAVGHMPWRRESRWMAGVLALGAGAALSHRAAGAHWGILRGSVPTELTVPTHAGRAHRDGLLVHRSLILPGHVEVRDGIPVTTLLRTILDLAAVLDVGALARAFEQAQVIHHLDPLPLMVEVECRRGYRGNAKLRSLLAGAVDPAAVRSVLELRFLQLCEEFGIPRPLVNEPIGAWTPDFWWPEHGLVVETDSAAFHSSLAARRRDPLKDEAFATLGLTLLRLRWRDVVEAPAATAATVLAHLARTPSVA
jgi:hypothetical protein